ncbi:MAG: DnaJ domain-containing protein [Bacteroidota bacterium]
MTHYDALGLTQDATPDELRRAYRRLVKIYHPDVNPSPEARIKIRQLTEAYDVLSDSYTRNLYDLELTDPQAYYTYTHPATEEESEEIRAWRAFRQQKAREERERIDNLIFIKIKFYKFQRWYSKAFLLLALVFTVDYFYWPSYELAEVLSIEPTGRDTRIRTSLLSFETSGDLLRAHRNQPLDHVMIYYSSIFNLPVQVGFKAQGSQYLLKIYSTLHTFNNVFSYIIIAISLIVIRKKQYEDWALTLAIIPFFLSGFLLLFVASA